MVEELTALGLLRTYSFGLLQHQTEWLRAGVEIPKPKGSIWKPHTCPYCSNTLIEPQWWLYNTKLEARLWNCKNKYCTCELYLQVGYQYLELKDKKSGRVIKQQPDKTGLWYLGKAVKKVLR